MLNTINLTNEQVEYISQKLQQNLKSVKEAYEDNLIFYQEDVIKADEDIEIINSILKELHTTV